MQIFMISVALLQAAPMLTPLEVSTLRSAYTVEFDDQITGGCWTNQENLNNELTQQLNRLGINAYRDLPENLQYGVTVFTISGLGYRNNLGNCDATVEFSVHFPAIYQSFSEYDVFIANLDAYSQSILYTGAANNLNSRISAFAREQILEYAVFYNEFRQTRKFQQIVEARRARAAASPN